MSQTVSKRVSFSKHYLDAQHVDHGSVSAAYKIDVTINDAMTQLTLKATCLRFSYTSSSVTTGDGGYSGVSLIVLKPQSTSAYANALKTAGNYWYKFASAGAPIPQGITATHNEVAKAYDETNWSAISSNVLLSAYVGDGNLTQVSGLTSVGQTATWTMALSASSFDADGNYIDAPLIVLVDRSWNYGNPHFTGHYINTSDTGAIGDRFALAEAWEVGFNSFDYYVGAIRKNFYVGSDLQTNWVSTNRIASSPSSYDHEYLDGVDGKSCIKKQNGWQDVKNTLNPHAATINKGHIKAQTTGWQADKKSGIDNS